MTVRKLLDAALLASLVAVAACAAPVGFQDPAMRSAALAQFRAGQAQLICPAGIDCARGWANARPAATRLVQAQRWEDLADVVLAANYDQDLAWFYLGLASARLGNGDAARLYLNRSVQRSFAGGAQACAAVGCDGVTLPNDALAVTATLPALPAPPPAPGRPRRPVARPRTPAQSSASPNWIAPVGGSAADQPGGAGWVEPVPASR